MEEGFLQSVVKWLLGPEPITEKRPGHLWPRWIFLRSLGLIYFSAFYSLLFQIRGLIGPNGILPAVDYLAAVRGSFHTGRFWFAPSLLWFDSSNRALLALSLIGMVAATLAAINIWPRVSLALW